VLSRSHVDIVGVIYFLSGKFILKFVSSNLGMKMRKNTKGLLIKVTTKREISETIIDEQDETEKFVKRLEIQRKLLNELVDLTLSQTPEEMKKEKRTKNKSTKLNKN